MLQTGSHLTQPSHRVHALMKDGSGWHLVTTTAFCLADEADIDSRVKVSVHLVLEEARNSEHAASFVFKVAPVI